jgi:hypothetical protein
MFVLTEWSLRVQPPVLLLFLSHMERSKSAPLGMVSVASIVPVPEGTVNECFVLSLPLLTVPVKVVVPRGSSFSSAMALRVAVADCVEACISGIVDMAKQKINKTVSINFVLFIFLISSIVLI